LVGVESLVGEQNVSVQLRQQDIGPFQIAGLSACEMKLKGIAEGNPAERYLVTALCYGFDFGPTQASRSIRGLDRRQVAFVNQRHVTEDKLNEAIRTVINEDSENLARLCILTISRNGSLSARRVDFG
jgi:hypothetical protein